MIQNPEEKFSDNFYAQFYKNHSLVVNIGGSVGLRLCVTWKSEVNHRLNANQLAFSSQLGNAS
jgi:hypothetical protein